MLLNRRRLRPAFALAFLLGCDGGAARNELQPAPTVLVTVKGLPAAGLSLRLHAEAGTAAGGGMTGHDGRATLRASDDAPVSPGEYKVTVIDAGEDEPDPMAVEVSRPKSRVPVVYAKPNSTPLRLTVEPGKMDYSLEVPGR